jgi:hypothetical protein
MSKYTHFIKLKYLIFLNRGSTNHRLAPPYFSFSQARQCLRIKGLFGLEGIPQWIWAPPTSWLDVATLSVWFRGRDEPLFCLADERIRLGQLGVKTERIRTDSSETVFVTIFFSNSELERIVCGYEYGIGVYR